MAKMSKWHQMGRRSTPRRGVLAPPPLSSTKVAQQALVCQHEQRAHCRGHLSQAPDDNHRAPHANSRDNREAVAAAKRTWQSRATSESTGPISRCPGDHGLLTPWAAAGRRRVVAGPHRQGEGAPREPTTTQAEFHRPTSAGSLKHQIQAPSGEGPYGPGGVEPPDRC
jgi:hypothetical protein